MHSIEDIRAEYARLDKLLGINTGHIELKISSRAQKQLGSFRSPARPGAGPLRITIAKSVMEDEALFMDTIRHEYAHAAAYILYPGEKHGHDKVWKDICRRIGCTPRSRTKLSDEAMAERRKRAKYRILCLACGSESLYLRRGRAVDMLLKGRGRNLRCTKCGGNRFELDVRE